MFSKDIEHGGSEVCYLLTCLCFSYFIRSANVSPKLQKRFSCSAYLLWNGTDCLVWTLSIICDGFIVCPAKKRQYSGGHFTQVRWPCSCVLLFCASTNGSFFFSFFPRFYPAYLYLIFGKNLLFSMMYQPCLYARFEKSVNSIIASAVY